MEKELAKIKNITLERGGLMIYPEFLKEKDTIGVTAPSDGITDEVKLKRLDNAIKSFEERSFNIKETPNVRCSVKGRSASSKERAYELESLYKDNSVNIKELPIDLGTIADTYQIRIMLCSKSNMTQFFQKDVLSGDDFIVNNQSKRKSLSMIPLKIEISISSH